MGSHIATWLLVGGSIVVLLFDTWSGQQIPPMRTISETYRDLASRNPIVPFALGMLIGHLTWTH